jgi:NNP family nitrate/nitrite transporter-like MFS transporter
MCGNSRRITNWDPEDRPAWEAGNKAIARRNLICTMTADHAASSVWALWSVLVLFMPSSVYGFSGADKLLLGAVAALSGGCVRIPYTLGIARFGGRTWTTFSALVLVIPTAGTIVLLANPGLPLWPYLVCAALTGLGGGNYSASLVNVNAFYPQRRKGLALALNAGGGHLGVAAVQLVGLLVIATLGGFRSYWVGAIYLVLLCLAGVTAPLFMDNLEYSIDVGNFRSILSEPDTWVIALLYACAFGSFIGLTFGFGRVLYVNFLAGGQTPGQAALHVAQISFLGPLAGSLARIYGGWLSDRVGGSPVALRAFAGMAAAAALLVGFSIHDEHTGGAATADTLIGYSVGFIALFIGSGIGSAAVFKMIPSLYAARGPAMSGALIGFAGTFGAFGGVAITLALRQSYVSTGEETTAFWGFLVCYLAAFVLTWAVYLRRPAPVTPELTPQGRSAAAPGRPIGSDRPASAPGSGS